MNSKIFKHKRVAIDFDGTLFYDVNDVFDSFEKNEKLIPIPNAANGLKFLKDNGFEILIYTCRPDYHRKYIEEMLESNNIIHDYILFYTKPRVDLYIDNKGYRFTDWNSTTDWIKSKL